MNSFSLEYGVPENAFNIPAISSAPILLMFLPITLSRYSYNSSDPCPAKEKAYRIFKIRSGSMFSFQLKTSFSTFSNNSTNMSG